MGGFVFGLFLLLLLLPGNKWILQEVTATGQEIVLHLEPHKIIKTEPGYLFTLFPVFVLNCLQNYFSKQQS